MVPSLARLFITVAFISGEREKEKKEKTTSRCSNGSARGFIYPRQTIERSIELFAKDVACDVGGLGGRPEHGKSAEAFSR